MKSGYYQGCLCAIIQEVVAHRKGIISTKTIAVGQQVYSVEVVRETAMSGKNVGESLGRGNKRGMASTVGTQQNNSVSALSVSHRCCHSSTATGWSATLLIRKKMSVVTEVCSIKGRGGGGGGI